MNAYMTQNKILKIENTWIPLSDGCRLAARIWMPENATTTPVPAILKYLPYRKRDETTERDALTHPYMAARGYGNGESNGLMADEYTQQEQDDYGDRSFSSHGLRTAYKTEESWQINRALEGKNQIFQKSWDLKIPRNFI